MAPPFPVVLRRARAAALVVLVAAARASPAAAATPVLVPGRMGFNALPTLPNADPIVGERGELELGAAAQASGSAATDAALTPYFRVAIPFASVAALDVDGTPLEWWRTTRETQLRIGAAERTGVANGDLRFGARFLFAGEQGERPALGLRFVVKSTTGKSLDSRRFTDTPAYIIDALLGKDLGTLGPARLRGLAKVGFLAWQMAGAAQDDALDYGATLRAAMPHGAIEVEWRGYAGWRGQDHPEVVGATAALLAGRSVELRATWNRGLTRDAPPYEARFGMVFRIGMDGPPRGAVPVPVAAVQPAQLAPPSAPTAASGASSAAAPVCEPVCDPAKPAPASSGDASVARTTVLPAASANLGEAPAPGAPAVPPAAVEVPPARGPAAPEPDEAPAAPTFR